MFWKKIFWITFAVAAYIASQHFNSALLLAVASAAGVMWVKAEVFHLSFDASLAAIKHYDATAADIEEYEEDDFDSEHQDTTLDSDTFLRRIKSMDEFS